MKIIMLWGQRKCSYPGQYAPELLAAIDEIGYEDNPELIDETYKECVESEDFSAVRIIQSEIDNTELDEILGIGKIEIKNLRKF